MPSAPLNGGAAGARLGFGSQLVGVLEGALALAADMLDADYTVIAEPLGEGESLMLRLAGLKGTAAGAPVRELLTDVEQNMAGQVLLSGGIVSTPNLAQDQRFQRDPLRESGAGGVLMAPLIADTGPLCALGLVRTRPSEFLPDEVAAFSQIIQPLASMVVLAREPDLISQRKGGLPGVAGALDEKSRSDCRSSPRHEYHYTQWIAPVRSWSKPTPGDFTKVKCGDLSAGGFSMWLDRLPEYRELVVALGKPPAVAYLRARIVHTRDVDRGGCRWYQVGCQFLERVFL